MHAPLEYVTVDANVAKPVYPVQAPPQRNRRAMSSAAFPAFLSTQFYFQFSVFRF